MSALRDPLALLIAAAEIGFWLFAAAGLLVRYALRRPRLGAALLVGSPLLDVVLLVAATADLFGGGTAGQVHALAAAYIAGSVVWGHRMVRWLDVRVAHRFAGGPPPVPRPRYGAAKVRYEWEEWGRAVLFWAIACGLMGALVLAVGDAGRTAALTGLMRTLTVAVGIWFVAFPVWTTFNPPQDPRMGPPPTPAAPAAPSEPAPSPARAGPGTGGGGQPNRRR